MTNKKKMKAGSLLCALVSVSIAISLLSSSYTSNSAAANSPQTQTKNAAGLASELLGGSGFSPVSESERLLSEDVFGRGIVVVENTLFKTIFDADSMAILSITAAGGPQPMFGKVASEQSAVREAEAFAFKVSPNLFFTGVYDKICSKVDLGMGRFRYTVELREKFEDKFYTGNVAAVMLDSDGSLYFLVNFCKEGVAGKTAPLTKISEPEAVGLAYKALAGYVHELENADPESPEGSLTKNSAGEAVPWNEALYEPYEFKIMIEDIAAHTIEAHRTVRNGSPVWAISVSNVSTSQGWDMGFEIAINANTGTIEHIFETR